MSIRTLALCLLATGICAYSQSATLTLTASKTGVRSGDVITLTYTIAGQASPTIAAFQFDQTTLSPIALSTIATPVTGKTITCTASGSRCVLVGIGSTAFANGTVATANLTIPTLSIGTTTIKLSNILAVLGTSVLTSLTSGPDLVLTILPAKEDVNGDGKIDINDIVISVLQVLSGTCNPTVDQNGDGVCDIRDVQAIAAKAQ